MLAYISAVREAKGVGPSKFLFGRFATIPEIRYLNIPFDLYGISSDECAHNISSNEFAFDNLNIFFKIRGTQALTVT